MSGRDDNQRSRDPADWPVFIWGGDWLPLGPLIFCRPRGALPTLAVFPSQNAHGNILSRQRWGAPLRFRGLAPMVAVASPRRLLADGRVSTANGGQVFGAPQVLPGPLGLVDPTHLHLLARDLDLYRNSPQPPPHHGKMAHRGRKSHRWMAWLSRPGPPLPCASHD